jgi:adenylosuccinate synthase
MRIDVVLGLQWGDEGKGKIVDFLAPGYDMVCRFQGGPNAGHTLYINGKKMVLHTVPSGIFHPNMLNLIGNGVVIDPITLREEITTLTDFGVDVISRLLIAEKAHLILPTHRLLDVAAETSKGQTKIGSTLRGIGPTYMDKTGRNGLRVGDIMRPDFRARYDTLKEKHLGLLRLYPEIDFDLSKNEDEWFDSIEFLKDFKLVAGEYYLNDALDRNHRILAEGAQGTMLDIDFGTYPYVTSSNTLSSGVCSGLGVSPARIGRVLGVSKAYCTRVGHGPFPTELLNDVGDRLREAGHEFGSTTGRPRRCGWIDIPQLRYATMVNGVTDICFTKIDVLSAFEEIGIGVAYTVSGNETTELPFDFDNPDLQPVFETMPGWASEISMARELSELPEAVQTYIDRLQSLLVSPIAFVSTGPERDSLIAMNDFARVYQ